MQKRTTPLGHAVVVAAVLSIAVYVVAALLRMGYPFELEWQEGGEMVEQSQGGGRQGASVGGNYVEPR